MAPRFSLPSASVGIDRFHCWPVDTTDSYSASELTANWDLLDAILGAPSSGAAWPPTTGLDSGIYKLILDLQMGAAPIGTTGHWYRPSTLVPLTTITDAGWHVCDGTTLSSTQHSFPGLSGQSVTLPDLRHRMILGADPNLALGQAAAAAGSSNIDSAAGAPGPNATGGSNQTIQSTSQMPAHNHSFSGNALGAHTHSFSGATLGAHNHWSVTGNNSSHAFEAANDLQGGGGRKAIVDIGSITFATDSYESVPLLTSSETAGTPVGTNTAVSAGTPSGAISTVGSGTAMDRRARWIGLIPIIKVLTVS